MPKKKKKGELPSKRVRRSAYVGKRADGTNRYEYFIADTAAEAEALAAAFRIRVKELRRQGVAVEDIPRDIDAPVDEKRGLTVGDAMDAFIDTCRMQDYSPATVPAYLAIRRNSFPNLVGMQIAAVTAPDVQNALNARAVDHAIKTVRNDYYFLKKVLALYRPDLSLINVTLAKGRRKKRQLFKQSWALDILRYAHQKEEPDFYIYCAFAISAGLRPSEIYALRWDDISREPVARIAGGKAYQIGLIHVTSAEVRDEYGQYTRKGTKTEAGTRVLSVDWSFFAALYKLKAPASGEKIVNMTPDNIKKRWHRARAALGLPDTMRFYDLRHFYATSVATSGATEDELAARMGHSTSAFSHAVYVELFEDRQDAVNEALAASTQAIFSQF